MHILDLRPVTELVAVLVSSFRLLVDAFNRVQTEFSGVVN